MSGPECLGKGQVCDCAKSGASRAQGVMTRVSKLGKQAGCLANTVARARALGCACCGGLSHTQGERGGYEVVGLLQLLILGWRIDNPLSYFEV